MNTRSVRIEITGKTPLLIHAFTEPSQQAATSGSAIVITGDRGTPREQAEAVLYKNEEGKCIMPQPNVFRCIIDAGKYFKNGKSKVTTIKSSIIPACLDLEGVYYLIKSKEGWDVDARPVRMPSTGGRILRYRPCFNDWSISFEATLDLDMMGMKMLREILDAAGSRIGLGDFRPDCKGCFGKFVVTSWKEAA